MPSVTNQPIQLNWVIKSMEKKKEIKETIIQTKRIMNNKKKMVTKSKLKGTEIYENGKKCFGVDLLILDCLRRRRRCRWSVYILSGAFIIDLISYIHSQQSTHMILYHLLFITYKYEAQTNLLNIYYVFM